MNPDGKHWFDGVCFSTGFPATQLERVKQIQFQKDDLLIATYPKAGTTWMQEIAYLVSTEGNFDGAKSSFVLRRSPFLEMRFDDYDGIDLVAEMNRPCNMKTHLQYQFFESAFKQNKPKVIIVMRNLKDNLVSYYHFYHMVKGFNFGIDQGFDKFLQLSVDNQLVHGDWFEFNLGWWKHKDDPKFLFVTYEEMKKDVRSVIYKMCTFLNKKLEPTTVDAIIEHTTFGKMKHNSMVNYETFGEGMDHNTSPFMRKGMVGDWKNLFTEEQNDICNKLLAERLAGTGLDEIYKPSSLS